MAKKILIAFQNDGSLETVVARKALASKLMKELGEESEMINTFLNSPSHHNEDYFFNDSSHISVRSVTVLFPDLNKDRYDEIYLTPMLASNSELTNKLMCMLKPELQNNVYTYYTKRNAGDKKSNLSINKFERNDNQ